MHRDVDLPFDAAEDYDAFCRASARHYRIIYQLMGWFITEII